MRLEFYPDSSEDIYGDKGAPTIHYSGRDIAHPLQIIRHSFYIMD